MMAVTEGVCPFLPSRSLAADQIDVWLAKLQGNFSSTYQWNMLSEEERARASRFRFEHDRAAFVSGRAQVRQILACYLGRIPEELEFSYGPAGKPGLTGEFLARSLGFNLSQCGGLELLGVCEGMGG